MLRHIFLRSRPPLLRGSWPRTRYVMPSPVKHSIAVAIFSGDKILSVRRPDHDDELPGVWGLPAGTLRAGESTNDLIQRIGRDKLGVKLAPVRQIISGKQMRPKY